TKGPRKRAFVSSRDCRDDVWENQIRRNRDRRNLYVIQMLGRLSFEVKWKTPALQPAPKFLIWFNLTVTVQTLKK
ncbi:MAG TPA: hypothetical protein VEQ63_10220, partial [Bryobacteraceae bacterium]|nr:hypothetical protein [Bryobacteraceae bacterium]